MLRDDELMRLHVEALFTHDEAGRLVRVNEPDGAPAPRFFRGRTADGVVLRYRHDVPHPLRRALEAVSERERPTGAAADPAPYVALLAGHAPVQRVWTGPALRFPRELPAPGAGTVLVTEGDEELLRPLLSEWLPDVRTSQPMAALVVDGRAVAVCCSVRRTGRAHEAGVETVRAFRGHGHAVAVTAAWARAVRGMGLEPLYSTSWENTASRAVARRLGLVPFGDDLHVT